MPSFTMLSPIHATSFTGDWGAISGGARSLVGLNPHIGGGSAPTQSGQALMPFFTGGTINLGSGFIPILTTPIGFCPTNNIVGNPPLLAGLGPPYPDGNSYSSSYRTFADFTGFPSLYISINIVSASLVTNANSLTVPVNSQVQITGDYIIVNFNWTVEGGPAGTGPFHSPTTPYNVGDEMHILSPDLNPDLTNLESITLTYQDSTGATQTITVYSPFVTNSDTGNINTNAVETFFLQAPDIAAFILPVLPDIAVSPNNVVIVSGVIPTVDTDTGTTFTGHISLGTITINAEPDHSGIYTLTDGKRNDTLYNQDSGGTNDYAISNPMFRTGFIG